MIDAEKIIRERKKKQRIQKIKVLFVVLLLVSITGYATYTIVTVTWIVPSLTPSVTLLHPADDESFATNTTYFNWTGSGGVDDLWYVWYADTNDTFTSPNLRIVDVNTTENYTAEPFYDGDWYWRVEVTDNVTQNVSVTWHFIIQTNASNHFPYLTNPQVSPTSGDTTTTFYYNVTYNDPDNDSASTINVTINGNHFVMTETDPTDTDTTDGKDYTYSTSMPVGSHNYSFICSDNNATNSTALFNNPLVEGDYNPDISGPSPANGEWDVEVTDKGVQTCINVTVPQNCTVNVTLQWFNWTQYIHDWYDWSDGEPFPDYYNDSYWYNYSTWTGVNASQRLCAWQENVTCYTHGSKMGAQDWRVIADFTCAGNYTYNETNYYYYYPEECPVNYIYPPSPNGTVCPCCDAMCINVSNALGHNMNITIYRNDTQSDDFYIVNKFLEVSDGKYCFCIDGHINDSIYYPMMYNSTYFWYVNVTDAVTGETTISDTFRFFTEEFIEDCPCGKEDFEDILVDYSQKDYIIGIVGVIGILGLLGYLKRRRDRE